MRCHYDCSPIDCGGHEDKVGTNQLLDKRKRNGSRLVDAEQLSLFQLVAV